MSFDIGKRVHLDLDTIRASLLVEAVMGKMEEANKDMSLDAVCKYTLLREVGQLLIDQLVPRDQQEAFYSELLQSETLLAAIKREKEKEAGDQ